jgi:hypothetical protein
LLQPFKIADMPINNNFLAWKTPPPGIQGYANASPLSPIVDCIQKEQTYALPVRGGDVLKFIYPNASETLLLVALMKNGVVINNNIGSLNGIYGTAIIPAGLGFGFYNLLIYTEVTSYTSDWVTVSTSCELDQNGDNTGYQLTNQERTYGLVPTAVALSDCLHYGLHRKSSIIRFRDDTEAFGFDYTSDLSFHQQFRLHVEVVFPEYPVEEAVYRQSNGYRRFGNVYIDEKQEMRTAAMDQRTHQCLISACKHRYFFINGCQYFAAGAYNIENVERGLSATARIDIFTQDFDLRNYGCQPDQPLVPLGPGDYSPEDFASQDYS